LKQICYIFLYLNIYTSFFLLVHAQEIKLTISSETSVSETLKDSLQLVKNHIDYKSIEDEATRISRTLEQFGYIESNLVRIDKINDSVCNAHYFFGKKYTFIKVYFKRASFTKKQLEEISEDVQEDYFTLSISESENALQKLNKIQTQNGNAFGKLKLSNFRVEEKTISATLETNSNTKRTIDSIAIKGYQKFPKSFIKHYAGIKKGEIFDKEEVLKKNNALNSLGFAKSLKPPEVLFEKEKTTLYLYLDKQNFNTFDGILGFATNEETQNLEFNGYLDLALNNNLNFGEQLIIKYKADGGDQQNLTVRTVLPYLLKTPFGIAAELNIFKRDSTFSSTSQEISTSYQISPPSKGYIGYRANTSSNLLSTNPTPESLQDFEARFIIGGLDYIKPQNSRLFPLKTAINLEIAIGDRETNTTKQDQTKISNTINHIFYLNQKNAFYIQNSTSILISDDYLTNELFRFGGINSIRGFTENSIDASLFSILNTEYRYLLNPNTYIHTIIDVGYFENEVINQKEKLYSFGIGLGLLTKAGILKFNLANGNIENQAFKFSNTKIHISLTSRF
jgi:hypothetical protein